MRRIKFLHCADVHVDMPFTSIGMGNDRSSIRRQDLKDTFQRIINFVQAENVDLLLIAGDLFEQDYVRKSSINFLNDKFSEIPDVHVFIVPGNHDPYLKNSCYRHFNWNSNVHILTGDEPYLVLEDIGVCIYGIGFINYNETAPIIDNLKPVDKEWINILVAHGTVDLELNQNNYNPMSSKKLDSLGMDYIALGHFHSRMDESGPGRNIYNPGSPEPLGFDETGEHGVFTGTIVKGDDLETQLDIKFVKFNKRYYENISVSVDGCKTDEQIIAKIRDKIYSKDISKGLFCITLKGYIDKGFSINIDQIRRYFEDMVFYIKVKNETIADYDFNEIIKEPGLRGLFTRKMYMRINNAIDDNQKKLLMKALYYGLEALEQEKIEIDK